MPSPSNASELKARMSEAVDVPGTFNNCFFNTYAAYLISNNMPLPGDLFIPNPDPHAKASLPEQLKKVFTCPHDLTLFDNFYKKKFPEVKLPRSTMAEKTFILGILLREWFTNKLLDNKENQQRLLSGNNGRAPNLLQLIQQLNSLPDAGPFDEIDLKEEIKRSPIYAANQIFFEAIFTEKPKPTEEDLITRCTEYWNKEGYINYCHYLAHPGITIAASDVMPILTSEKIPFVFYDKQSGIATQENLPHSEKPPFEVALAAGEGHYYLLKNKKSESSLEQYEAALLQYKLDEETIRAKKSPDQKLLAISTADSLLVAVTSSDKNTATRSQLLIESLNNMKKEVYEDAEKYQVKRMPNTKSTDGSSDAVTIQKTKQYQNHIKDYINNRREIIKNVKNHIPIDKLDSAKANKDESDEDFAKRLQEAEYRKAGFK
jgi:hypothetical protein